MFDGLHIPFAIETVRRNPVRQSVRNLVINRGDYVTLDVQVYEPDGTPTDISGASVGVTIIRMADHTGSHSWWSGWDYGLGWWTDQMRVVYDGEGTVLDGTTGQAAVVLPLAVTACLWGRYGFLITLDGGNGAVVQARGVLDARGGPVRMPVGLLADITVSDGVLVAEPVVQPPVLPAPSALATSSLLAADVIRGHRALMFGLNGNVVEADPSALSYQFAGISINAAASGAVVSVAESGATILEPTWSWTPGNPVYTGPQGVLTQTVPTTGWLQQIGTPLTPTALLVEPFTAVFRS